MSVPSLNYNFFRYGVQNMHTGTPENRILDHLPTEPIAVSFKNGYNQIEIHFTPSCPLCYYEARITKVGDEFGIGVGILWGEAMVGNIAGSTPHTFIREVNPTYFTEGDVGYRIGLYAKASDSQGFWDVTYLLLTTEADNSHKIFAPSDYDGIEVLTDEPIPTA